jgi:L-iditol 2-dehydrogenase
LSDKQEIKKESRNTQIFKQGGIKMKAAMKVGKEKFQIIDVPTPEITPEDCLVRIKYCAVCAWCYEEWLRDGENDLYGPGITGHEMTGVVEQVGSAVKSIRKGDRVSIYFSSHCGSCPECLDGKETQCMNPPGKNYINGYAEYIAVRENCLLPIPDSIDLKHAGLIGDMIGTTMHAIRRAFAVNINRKVVAVWGLGPVGLFAVQGLKTFQGVEKVIAIDPVRFRRDLALELGADEALDPKATDIAERLKKENEGRGVHYAFNCAIRNPDIIKVVFDTIKHDGYLMNITGAAQSGFQTEKRIDGSFYFYKKEYEENVRLVTEGRIRLEPVMTHEFSLDDINEAMELRAKHPEKAIKVTISV